MGYFDLMENSLSPIGFLYRLSYMQGRAPATLNGKRLRKHIYLPGRYGILLKGILTKYSKNVLDYPCFVNHGKL